MLKMFKEKNLKMQDFN